MKFGRLSDISNVDFSLPVAPTYTKETLDKFSVAPAPALYVGCTGWSMKEWLGQIYPKKTKTKDYLKHYTKQFNTIELNTTHYRIPNAATIEKWYNESTEDFRFCPKIPQSISHSNGLGLNDGKLSTFCEAIAGLQEKIGCCFMQMPPYFDAKRLGILATFLDHWPASIPLSVEVRHESWFADQVTTLSLAELLAGKNCAFVITDVAGRRDVIHQMLTNNKAVIRFNGNDLHPTDYTRIDEWVAQLKTWFDQGLREVYFFTHEPDNIRAPEIALYLVEKAKAIIPNVATRGPKFIEEQGQQLTLLF
ncbi:MAG: DUF72 domain-containing protein [Bacteroidota bacterium]